MNKKINAKILSVLLIFSLLVSALPFPYASALSLGDSLWDSDFPLNNGAVLHNNIIWSGNYQNRQTENYIEYKPNSSVTPVVAYGSKLYGRSTLTTAAAYLESLGKRPVAAVNGDFFNLNSGIPIGIVMTDGILRTSDEGLQALGINSDGTVFIGTPSIHISVTDGITTVPVAHVNKVRTTSGAVLYTPDFSATTRTTAEGVDVVLSSFTDQLRPGTAITAVVESVNPASKGALTLVDGSMILSVNKSADPSLVAAASALIPGSTVTITLTAGDSRFNNALYAVGGLEKLVTGGSVNQNLAAGAAPRSAVGVKADGSLILYTIDGRQTGYSSGATLTELAHRMSELGCIEAINLDGGGSTAIAAVYPGDNSMSQINKPSDGSLRPSANFIFLVNNEQPTHNPAMLFLSPRKTIMLNGAETSFSAKATDSAYYPVNLTSAVTYSAEGTNGEQSGFSGNVFKASQAGDYVITGFAAGIYGDAAVTVIDNPHYITVTNEKTGLAASPLTVNPGAEVDLKAHAYYNNLAITAEDPCFVWEVSGDIGTIDQNGLFTAANMIGASGSISVSAGTCVTSVEVTVGILPDILESFENGNVKIDADYLGGATFKVNPAMDRVKIGYKSGRIDYDFSTLPESENDTVKSAHIPASLSLNNSPSYVKLWVYGDGSGNTLTANLSGKTEPLILCTLDFKDWKLIAAKLPEKSSVINAIGITNTGTNDSGTVYIDQLMSVYGESENAFLDETPPNIGNAAVVVEPGSGIQTLTARITDNLERHIQIENITVTYDGGDMPFTFQADELLASLPPDDGNIHRVTIEAYDRSGNRARVSIDLNPIIKPESPFADMAGHWATDYVTYLNDHDIITGSEESGELRYLPDVDMTRLDFSVAIIRLLGVDITAYSSVQLPFSDVKDIPDWALDSVKAAYSLGIVGGRANGGRLDFAPQDSLTRAEAMTIMGRILPRGYQDAELEYTDSKDVPEWAAPFVKTMTKLGILSGFNNNIMPNKNVTRSEIAKIIYMLR